jgi:hypothetical protein
LSSTSNLACCEEEDCPKKAKNAFMVQFFFSSRAD